ncbi:MAG: M1 family peptidase, partial [Brevundimonas sp.]
MIRAAVLSLLLIASAQATSAQTVACPPASSAFTLTTGTERAPEQVQVRFDRADLSIRVLPDQKRIEGAATLDFTATATLHWLPLELDGVFTIRSIVVDGVELSADDDWRQEDGRLWIDLGRELQAGQSTRLRIVYDGAPHQAKNAPWDGGFVWSTTPDGKP